MSIWRDIWRQCVTANRIMAEDEEDGLIAFHRLFQTYGDDGMIHYAKGEAWEYRRNKAKAVEEYNKAQELFPVPHWKNVASDTIRRVQADKCAEAFFDSNDFEELLWLVFQKVYEFVHLEDFMRYVALSALSRATSEWPLALVDFRTVLELGLKQIFPEIVDIVNEQPHGYTLFGVLKELQNQREVPRDTLDTMHQIRMAGNIAAHDAKNAPESEKCESAQAFLDILTYFDKKTRI